VSPWGETKGDEELAELMDQVAYPSFNRLAHWGEPRSSRGRPARATSPLPTLMMRLTRKSGAAKRAHTKSPS
jgi:hypothetical protein